MYLTPKASAVMLVSLTTELAAITLKVPNSKTRRCWEYTGSEVISLTTGVNVLQ